MIESQFTVLCVFLLKLLARFDNKINTHRHILTFKYLTTEISVFSGIKWRRESSVLVEFGPATIELKAYKKFGILRVPTTSTRFTNEFFLTFPEKWNIKGYVNSIQRIKRHNQNQFN